MPVFLGLALVVTLPAAGQEAVLAIEFDFSNPGARSLGFAGAFGGLADDATAAFANPSGLVQLTRPEISAEGRSWRYTTPYTAGGRISGDPTGVGIDTTAGLRTEQSTETLHALSFLSFVYPHQRWRVAVYRHQLAKFRFFSETQGLIRSLPEGGPGAIERFAEQRSSIDFEIVSYGVSSAYRVTDRFSLGLGVAYFEGDLQASGEQYLATSFFDPSPYRPEDLEAVSVFSIESSDWGFNAGFLWEFVEHWRLGGFFREGPEFELRAVTTSGPGGPAPPGTVIFSASSPVQMPDVYGLGLSYRSQADTWTIAFEWNRVEYASIVDSLDPNEFDVTATVDDGDELHLGAEYVFLRSKPIIAVRGGVWLDPDHRLRATEDADVVVKALRQPGDDEIHVAAGLGFVFERIKLDLAFDYSDRVNTASISLIYSF